MLCASVQAEVSFVGWCDLQSNGSFTSRICVAFLAMFFLALAIRIWFCFGDGHQTQINALDASEYIRNARAVKQFVSAKPSGFWIDSILDCVHFLPVEKSSALHAEYGALSELITRSGPVYPGFLAIALALGEPFFGSDSLDCPVLWQCILGSLTCLLIAFSAGRLFDYRAGLCSGVMAALYPGFIVNTVRLISESFATFLSAMAIALVVALLTGNKHKPLLAFALGLSLALLQLTRSALILVSIATVCMGLVLVLLKKKSAPTSMGCIVAGIGLVLMWFLGLQSLIIGSGSLVVDRLSHYNLFVGLNLDSLGWLAYPLPNLALCKDLSYIELIQFEFLQSPTRFMSLMLDKIPRLFAWPFNDFHTSIGGLSCFWQIVIHQIYLALALTGAVLVMFCSSTEEFDPGSEKGLKYARLYLVVFLLMHLAYIFFVSLARYALTAMPIIIIFSGIGAVILCRQWFSTVIDVRRSSLLLLFSVSFLLVLLDFDWTGIVSSFWGFDHFNKVAIFLVIVKIVMFGSAAILIYHQGVFNKTLARVGLSALALVLLPFVALPLTAYGSSAEWRASLDRAWPEAVQKLKPEKNVSGLGFLLIDCPDWTTLGQATQVYINDRRLDTKAMPLLPLNGINGKPKLRNETTVYFEFEDILSSMFNAVGGSIMNMRQWFILPVPGDLLTSEQELRVRIAVKPDHETRLYGAYSSRRGQVSIPGLEMHSWEKLFYGIENKRGLSDPRYTRKFNVQELGETCEDLSSDLGKQTGQFNIRLLCSNSVLHGGEKIKSEETVFELGDVTDGFTRELAMGTLAGSDLVTDPFWLITVRGRFYSDQKRVFRLPVDMTLKVMAGRQGDKNFRVYESPWLPTSFVVCPGDNQFAFTIPVNLSGFVGDSHGATMRFSVKPGGRAECAELFGVGLADSPRKSIDWKRLSIEVSQIDKEIDVNSADIF